MSDEPYTTSGIGQPDFTQQVRQIVVSIDNLKNVENLLASGDAEVTAAINAGNRILAERLAQLKQVLQSDAFAFDVIFYKEQIRDTGIHFSSGAVTILQNEASTQRSSSGQTKSGSGLGDILGL